MYIRKKLLFLCFKRRSEIVYVNQCDGLIESIETVHHHHHHHHLHFMYWTRKISTTPIAVSLRLLFFIFFHVFRIDYNTNPFCFSFEKNSNVYLILLLYTITQLHNFYYYFIVFFFLLILVTIISYCLINRININANESRSISLAFYYAISHAQKHQININNFFASTKLTVSHCNIIIFVPILFSNVGPHHIEKTNKHIYAFVVAFCVCVYGNG